MKLEKETSEVLDSDGWVHSGDIGRWLPNGVLKVIDRKKSLIKLQQVNVMFQLLKSNNFCCVRVTYCMARNIGMEI